MGMPTGITSNIQLLVEGKDQRNFFERFCKHLSLQHVEIHDFGGISELNRFLPAFALIPEFEKITRLGIIRDAEQNAASAFQSVQSALEKARLPFPERPRQLTPGSPAITVLILPGNEQSGMLETLLCKTLAGQPENACIDEFLECITTRANVFLNRPDKSRAHAFLSTKEHPQSSVGVAAMKGYWNLDHDAFSHVRDFLTKLAR